MILIYYEDSSRLFRIFYRKSVDHPLVLRYSAVNEVVEAEYEGRIPSPHPSKVDLSDTKTCKACTWLKFPVGISWAPERLEVNGRKGKRVICVLAQDRLRYRVYDLDNSLAADDGQGMGE